MAVQMPTREQLRAVARQCGLALDDASVDSFRALFTTYVDAYNTIAAMPDEVPRVKYPRTPGYRPGPEENKYNAWYYKSEVQGAPSGKLWHADSTPKGSCARASANEASATPSSFRARARRPRIAQQGP